MSKGRLEAFSDGVFAVIITIMVVDMKVPEGATFAGVAYFILAKCLVRLHGKDSVLALSIGRDVKGIASLIVYAIAIPLAFVRSWIACCCYVLVAVMWLLPDPRIEKHIHG